MKKLTHLAVRLKAISAQDIVVAEDVQVHVLAQAVPGLLAPLLRHIQTSCALQTCSVLPQCWPNCCCCSQVPQCRQAAAATLKSALWPIMLLAGSNLHHRRSWDHSPRQQQ
jgi:hypothetical protein